MTIRTLSPIGFAPRLAALYAASFMVAGIQLPFFPLWLKAKGLDAQMIGVVLAAPMIARLVVVPLVTQHADRRDRLRSMLIACVCTTVAGYIVIGFASAPAAIFVTVVLASAAYTPIMPLTDSYALHGLAAHGRAYGPVRLGGVHRRQFPGGLRQRSDFGARPDLADRCRLCGQRRGRVFTGALAAGGARRAGKPAAQKPVAQRRLSRGAGRGESHPGESCGLLQLLDGCLECRWIEWRCDRGPVGARRCRRNRAVRGFRPLAAVVYAHGFIADRRRRRRSALERDGVRSAGGGAAVAAIAAWPELRRDASRHARIHRAPRAARTRCHRAGLSCDRARTGDGGSDGVIGAAVRKPGRQGLRGDGVNGCRGRRLRADSAPSEPS